MSENLQAIDRVAKRIKAGEPITNIQDEESYDVVMALMYVAHEVSDQLAKQNNLDMNSRVALQKRLADMSKAIADTYEEHIYLECAEPEGNA